MFKPQKHVYLPIYGSNSKYVFLNADGSQQAFKDYNTGDSSWKDYETMLKEVFGGYSGDNPMAGYVQASGTGSFTNTNESNVSHVSGDSSAH